MIKNVTSDRIIDIKTSEPFNFPYINLLEIKTEKGMTLIVDVAHFGNLKVGHQINIYLEMIK